MKRNQDTECETRIAKHMAMFEHFVPILSCKKTKTEIELEMPKMQRTLLDQLIKVRLGKPFRLRETARLFRQMLQGIKTMHEQGYVHKDIKLENILWQDGTIYFTDFQFSRRFIPKVATLNDGLGSLHYAAPELWIKLLYVGPEVDIWSLGVCLYVMTTGVFPFAGDTSQQVFESMCTTNKTRLRFPRGTCRSTRLRNLIRRMLTFDISRRITIAQIETHPFVNGRSLSSFHS
ncbi:MAG: protein kinase, partial [Silvanigrellaceae bacterium]|nr:protein kinase [Silvanigrellaceae bacterium]